MSDRHHATTWRAHVRNHLDTVRAELLDLIDCGLDTTPPTPVCPECSRGVRCDRYPACSHPSQKWQRATDRRDGNFQPTPPGTTTRPGGTHSDPTSTAVVVWEGQVQTATTGLYATVAAAHEVADGLGLTPLDEQGRPLEAPPEPPTRLTTTGRRVVNVGPGECRRASLDALAYLAAVADRVADRSATAEGDVADAVGHRADWLAYTIARLARVLSPPPPPQRDTSSPGRTRACRCDHDECPHPPGGCGNRIRVETQARTCGTCRNRKSATAKAAS